MNCTSEAILFVDDDIKILSALQRSLYRTYQVEIAGDPEDALHAIAGSNYAVVVSDLKMPGINGTEFLASVRRLSPLTVRILLTGHADLDVAIAAVNEGNLFRFLTKPCSRELLVSTLDAALEQHRLQTGERELLDETLMGTVSVLVSVLGAANPAVFGRASRIRRYVRYLAEELRVADPWMVEAAAMLSQIGCIAVAPEILRKQQENEPLSQQESERFLLHPEIGRELLSRIRRLEPVAMMVGCQREPFRRGADSPPYSSVVDFGTQLLRTAIDFDQLLGNGADPAAALAELRGRESYDPAVLASLERFDHSQTPALSEAEPFGTYETILSASPKEHQIFRRISDEVIRSLKG